MVTRSLLALAAIVVLAHAAAGAPPQITTADPKSTKPNGDPTGSFGSVVAVGAREPESTTVSLDAVSGSPAKYEGKTLGRRVTLGSTKPSNGAVGLGARDVETNTKLGP